MGSKKKRNPKVKQKHWNNKNTNNHKGMAMGHFSNYLSRKLSFSELEKERKVLLKEISSLRNGRDILVYASDMTKNAPITIEYNDLVPFQDQLSNLTNTDIDIILETPGGFAEIVEDMVNLVRSKFNTMGIIVPGTAKSAGTIFTMAADEILMGTISALGPIDAQIKQNNKSFSAEAFLDGLDKIKSDVITNQRLNPAYIPILQNISPGEIQHCENAQKFSRALVTQWLSTYKFKDWIDQAGNPIPQDQKIKKAEEIAEKLSKSSIWLTHGRSIKINDLQTMGLKIVDYSQNQQLNEAITKYFILLKMCFESTNLYKIFETVNSQIYRFAVAPGQNQPLKAEFFTAHIDFKCPNCQIVSKIQANFGKSMPIAPGFHAYPITNDIFICPNCHNSNNIIGMRQELEAQTGKKIV